MNGKCRSVEERIQSCFDSGRMLTDTDLKHLDGCPSCGRLYNDNLRFGEQLRSAGETTLASLREPDWEEIVSPAGPEPRRTMAAPFRLRDSRFVNLLPKVAVIILFVGVGGLFGVRQYQLQRARSFLRSDTAEFVSSLVSSPLFPRGEAEATGIQSGWFDAASMELSLPSAPIGTAPTGGRGGAVGAGS